MNKLENFKKKLIYRSNYRGTKEMDILLSKFVRKFINTFSESELLELDKLLDLEDETIIKFYNYVFAENDIEKNKMSKIVKEFKN